MSVIITFMFESGKATNKLRERQWRKHSAQVA